MNNYKVYCFKSFWKDIKELKRHHIKGLEPQFEMDDTEDDLVLISNYPLVDAIKNFIFNNYKVVSKNHVIHDRQPFLNNDIEIWKMDWATDKKGTKGGLRILYCVNIKDSQIFMVYLNTKPNSADQHALEKEVTGRIKNYFGF